MSYRAKAIPGEVLRKYGDILTGRNIFRLDTPIGMVGWVEKKRGNKLKAASKARRAIRRRPRTSDPEEA